MADLDDDFGDIYTDVESQASSAINGVSDVTQFCTEPDEDHEDRIDKKNGGEGLVSDSRNLSSVSEELDAKVSGSDDDYSDCDSEDDLNIVLNDEGCKGVPFPISGGGSLRIDDCDDEDDDASVAFKDSKYVWTQGSAGASNGKANESMDLASSVPVGGDCSQISRVRDTPNPVVTRNRYGFQLPWYRSILDVDVESFEEKSWRYPGVDITDYFNFELNEVSWKEYCKSLQQLRRLKSTQYGTPGSSKYYQAKENGSEHGISTRETMSTEMNYAGSLTYAPLSSTVSDCRPIGKAIQIEDSIVERQPSFDSRHPRSWNSDVVIQISVQDPTQDTPNSSAEHGHTNSRTHEKSENGEFKAKENQDNMSYNTTNDDDSSLGSPEEDLRTLDGCSQKIRVTNSMTIDSDDHKNNQVIDAVGNKHKEVNGVSLEAIELTNTVTESPVRNTSSADQCMDAQLLLSDDDDQLSLISSCFESDSEANSAHFDPKDIHTPVRSVVNSQTEPHKSAASSFKKSNGNCIKRKRVDIQDYSICSSSQKKHNHHGGRLNSIDELSNCKYNDIDASPTSDTEDPNDWNCSENSHGHRERLRNAGSSDGADISDYKESKFSCHYGIRNADKHDRNEREQRKYLSEKGGDQLQPKPYPYVNRTFNEKQNFHEDTETDWKHFGITQVAEERSPLTTRETRGLRARYAHTVGKRDAQWRKNSNKLLCKKIPNYKWREDKFLGEKAGKWTSFSSWKRNHSAEYNERKLPPDRRQLRRGGYVGSPMYLDDPYYDNFEDGHRKPKANQYLCHQFNRDVHDGSWNHSLSPRNDGFYPRRTDERYWRHVRNVDVEEANEINWFDDHCDGYDIEDNMYANDHLRRRRSNWGSEVMHWTEDQFTVRHHGDELYSEKASCFYRKYVRHEKFHAKYGPLSDGMHVENMQPEQHRLKMPRKRFGANFVDRSLRMYRGKHEQSVGCRNLMDLAVREQKIPARCSNARNTMRNGRQENMGAGGDWMSSGNLQACESEKARTVNITPNYVWNQYNKKGHNMLPVTAQNADLDIEEGQIVPQEQNITHPSERKHAFDHTEPADSLKKGVFDHHAASNGNKIIEVYDQQRILQTMAKMEQRGERFKEPITLKKEPDKPFTPEVDQTFETADEKQHRPARKRRWGGRFSKNDSLMGAPLKASF